MAQKVYFIKRFILKGLIDKKFGFLYDHLLAKRFEADYENFALIDEKEVPEYLKSVKKFILKVKEIVSSK